MDGDRERRIESTGQEHQMDSGVQRSRKRATQRTTTITYTRIITIIITTTTHRITDHHLLICSGFLRIQSRKRA